MITVHCKCENGYTWSTSVNGKSTDAELLRYFMGQSFHTMAYNEQGKEELSRVIAVTIERGDA